MNILSKISLYIIFSCLTLLCYFIILWGLAFETSSPVKLVSLVLPCIFYFILLCINKEKLEFTTKTILYTLPVLGILVPPRRFGISIFDLLAILSFIFLFYYRIFKIKQINIFPSKIVGICFFLIIPSVIFSVSPVDSFISILHMIGYYVFFINVIHLLRYNKINLLRPLAVSLILCALAIFFNKLTGINLSLSKENLNVNSQIDGLSIFRASGFFQDPQKAAQFLACMISYSVVLVCRNAIKDRVTNNLSIVAAIVAIPALFLTVSKAGIVSGIVISMLSFFVLGKFKSTLSLGLSFIIIAATIGVSILHVGSISEKSATYKRLKASGNSLEHRIRIWEDSWYMASINPLFGIGPGSYREQLIREDPEYQKKNTAGLYVPRQPENGYLKILYETGIVGTAGCFLVLFVLFKQLFYLLFQDSSAYARSIAWSILCSLGCFLVTFIPLFTISDPRNSIILILLFAQTITIQHSQSDNLNRFIDE